MTKKELFKIVLEPSWGDLGSSWVPSWGRLGVVEWGFAEAKLPFVKNHVFGKHQVSGGDLGRFWVDLGAQEGPKGRPKGTQGGSKTRPK